MLEGEKNNLQAHTRKKKISLGIKVLKKNFTTRPNHPPPLPPPSQKSNGRPLIYSQNLFLSRFN